MKSSNNVKSFKEFNENLNSNESKYLADRFNELKDLAEGRLIYLMDEGFKLSCSVILTKKKTLFKNKNVHDFCIEIEQSNPNSIIPKEFEWNDVKDYIIPLLKQLSQENKVELELNRYATTSNSVDVDSIINNKADLPNKIRFITIKVRLKNLDHG